MTLPPPFIITSHLAPGLKIGDATLSLLSCERGDEGRHRAVFCLDIPDNEPYYDRNMQSGCGGFKGGVEVFESFLSFMYACAESFDYDEEKCGENADLFPAHIAAWCAENKNEIECLMCDLQVPDGNGEVKHELIEEEA